MNPQQLRYCTAKALADLAREAADKRIAREVPPPTQSMTDAELQAHAIAATRIDAECHVWVTCEAMVEAERDLIAWVREQVSVLPQYAAHQADMEKVFSTYWQFPAIREKLIRTCLQLRA